MIIYMNQTVALLHLREIKIEGKENGEVKQTEEGVLYLKITE